MSDETTATPQSSTSPVRSTLEMVGSVVAPVTAISSVLLYFGWNRQNAIYGYFGVDHSVLKLSVQDYLLRSVGVIFKPFAVILGCLAVLLVVNRVLNGAAQRTSRWQFPVGRRKRLPILPVLQLFVALLLLGAGTASLLGQWDALSGAFSLALGAALTLSILRAKTVDPHQLLWSQILIGAVIGFAVFWAATVYAARSGTSVAQYIDRYPTAQPALTVHSATQLDFPPGPVVETKIPAQDGKTRYRYSGLRLLSYANDRWVVIIGRESGHARATVTILKDSDSIRIELTGQ